MSITKKIFVGAFIGAFAFAFSTANAAYMHTVTLKSGSTGSQVMSLQQTLNMTSCKVAVAGRAGSPGMETSYFGPATLAAVKCFQASYPPITTDGIVGPVTGAKLALVAGGPSSGPLCPNGNTQASNCTTPPSGSSGPTCPNGNLVSNNCGSASSTPLSGNDGTIAGITKLSAYNNEEVGEGQDDVKIFGFEVEASNDGDVLLKSIKLVLDPTGNTGSQHLDDYVESVSVWMDSTEVGSADVDEFTENSDDTFSKVIALDSSSVIDSDEKVKFYVAVNAVNNFDSGDIGSADSWTVALANVRFEDGSGVVTTEVSAIASDIDWDAVDDGVAVDFVSFSSAADTELRISTHTDSPDAGVVIVDLTDDTDDVVLLKGKLRLDGSSDVTIDEFPVTFTPTGANINVIAGSLILVLDGEEFTESVPSIADGASASVTFNDLNFDLSAEDTIDFEVRADINDIEAGTFDESDTITASVTSTNRSHIDVENEEGDQLTDSEKTGTASGEAQEFRTIGIMVTLVDTDAVVTAGSSAFDDTGTFTIKFKVTAVGDDIYLATTAVVGDGYTYVVDDSGTATTGGVSAVIVNNTDTDVTSGENWLIEEGESETITLTVVRSGPPSDAGLYRAALTAIGWDTDDTGAVLPANSYTTNLDNFKTAYISLN